MGERAYPRAEQKNEVLRWVCWWHSTDESPADIGPEQIHYELSADFDTSLMDAEDVQALVAAWQMGAISRDTLLHNFRQGEILPSGRTNEQEVEKIRADPAADRTLLQKVAEIAKAH